MAINSPPFLASIELQRAKIMGKKVFASDFRASDLTERFNWPAECAHALLVRAACVNRNFLGLRLDRLSTDNQPFKIVTADTIKEAGFNNFFGKKNDICHICPVGMKAQYVSQPLAILLFEEFLTFRRAAQEIREDRGIVAYGKLEEIESERPLLTVLKNWQQLEEPQGYSFAHYLFSRSESVRLSQWTHGRLGRQNGHFLRENVPSPDDDALYVSLSTTPKDSVTIESITLTQQVDPAFLEPESGLAYLQNGTIMLLIGSQSPHSDSDEVQHALKVNESAEPKNSRISDVKIITVDSGGGFGGRDKSPFSIQLAFAAVFSDRPVRLAYDRFEQFQAGLKRHASAVHSRISCARNGEFNQAHIHFVFEGGVEPNLSSAVMGLGALHATGMYRFHQAGSHGVVTKRAATIVGSMRGFGIPQVSFNIETSVDKLAILKLNLDPIELRQRNALQWNSDPGLADCDISGTPLRFHVATADICQIACKHPLWVEREKKRQEAAEKGILRGVGFAACIEAYGTSEDSVYCAIQLEENGSFTIWSQSYDMGQGARRSIAAAATSILNVPVKVTLGEQEPFETFAAQLGAQSPKVSLKHGASSASKTAFFHVHVLKETFRMFLQIKILPFLKQNLNRDISLAELQASVKSGVMYIPNTEPLSFNVLAREMAIAKVERFVIGHGYFANGWSNANFSANSRAMPAYLDGLGFAIENGESIELVPVLGDVQLPPIKGPGGANAQRSGYAGGGHLVAVEINTASRSIRVTDAVAIIDAGDPLLMTQLSGQIEGGFQMGLAHTLFEELPAETSEDRFVNFDRYLLPRASDLMGINFSFELVPLPSEGALNRNEPNIRHKGVGEVTMTTVAPAISNAVAHALGNREEKCWPNRLPIRFEDLNILRKSDA